MCVGLYLIGLVLCQHSGEYWLQLFDSYSINTALLYVGILQLLAMNFVYGTNRYDVVRQILQSSKQISMKNWNKIKVYMSIKFVLLSLVQIFIRYLTSSCPIYLNNESYVSCTH